MWDNFLYCEKKCTRPSPALPYCKRWEAGQGPGIEAINSPYVLWISLLSLSIMACLSCIVHYVRQLRKIMPIYTVKITLATDKWGDSGHALVYYCTDSKATYWLVLFIFRQLGRKLTLSTATITNTWGVSFSFQWIGGSEFVLTCNIGMHQAKTTKTIRNPYHKLQPGLSLATCKGVICLIYFVVCLS